MYEQISSNIWRTRLVIFLFVALVLAMGWLFGELLAFGYVGVVIAAIVAVAMSFGGFYYSDQIVLKMSKARPANREEHAYLLNTVEGLAIAAGLPAPKAYVIDDTAPNAFATGRDPEHSAIAVTQGLMDKLDRQELEGVVAHEMSHIQNYDIRLMGVLAIFVGIVVLMSDWMRYSFYWGGGRRDMGRAGPYAIVIMIVALIMSIVAPLIAEVLRLSVSRKREYLADASGALLTRYPAGLASALQKISEDTEPLEVANKATAHLYIFNPLRDVGGRMNAMFETHPPVSERIKRLSEMSGSYIEH